MILEALVVGGRAYAGVRAYRQIKANGGLRLSWVAWPQWWLEETAPQPHAPADEPNGGRGGVLTIRC